jgi:hypothetical protein
MLCGRRAGTPCTRHTGHHTRPPLRAPEHVADIELFAASSTSHETFAALRAQWWRRCDTWPWLRSPANRTVRAMADNTRAYSSRPVPLRSYYASFQHSHSTN